MQLQRALLQTKPYNFSNNSILREILHEILSEDVEKLIFLQRQFFMNLASPFNSFSYRVVHQKESSQDPILEKLCEK